MNRTYPTQPLVGVGAVIIHDAKILLEKRKNEPGKGRWSIPGGMVEVGETIGGAIVREVKEETGLDVVEPECIDIVDNIVRDKDNHVKYHFVIIDCFVRLKGGSLRAASDADKLRWVLLGEVEKYDLTKTFRLFFQKNRTRLENFS